MVAARSGVLEEAGSDPDFPALLTRAARYVVEANELIEEAADILIAGCNRVLQGDPSAGLGYDDDRLADAVLHQALVWRTRPTYFTPATDPDGYRAIAMVREWTADDVMRRLDLYNNHDRHLPFWTWWQLGLLTPAILGAVALDVWSMVPTADIATADWVELFETAGFVSEEPDVGLPEQPIELWRGASPDRWAGISWTTSRTEAEWFAWRIPAMGDPPSGLLLRTVAGPRRLLGHTNGRQEHEWLLNPTGLHLGTDVTIVSTYDGSESNPRGPRTS